MRTTIVRTGIGCLLVGPLIAGFEIVAAAGTPGEPAPPGTPFVFGDEFSATEWTGTVLGFVDLERGPLSEGDPGRCVGIIGTLVPTVVEGLTSSGYSAPPMSVVADGRAVESFDGLLECDYQPLVDAGYGLLFEASVMVGVTYPFVDRHRRNALLVHRADLPGGRPGTHPGVDRRRRYELARRDVLPSHDASRSSPGGG